MRSEVEHKLVFCWWLDPRCDLRGLDKRKSIAKAGFARPRRRTSYFAVGASVFRRSLLIFTTMPAFRSATSLTLYSEEAPSTCATSDGVSLYSSVIQLAMF